MGPVSECFAIFQCINSNMWAIEGETSILKHSYQIIFETVIVKWIYALLLIT